jgi:hypothetical protein
MMTIYHRTPISGPKPQLSLACPGRLPSKNLGSSIVDTKRTHSDKISKGVSTDTAHLHRENVFVDTLCYSWDKPARSCVWESVIVRMSHKGLHEDRSSTLAKGGPSHWQAVHWRYGFRPSGPAAHFHWIFSASDWVSLFLSRRGAKRLLMITFTFSTILY